MKIFNGLICTAILVVASLHEPLFAKSELTSPDKSGKQRYIVVLEDLPLSVYDGRSLQTPERDKDSIRLQATANRVTGARKLDVNSERSKQYLHFLDERFQSFHGEAALKLGRQLQVRHRYRIAVNGFATELGAAEVSALRGMPGVRAVYFDEVQRLETDSGPNWLGADKIHDGSVGFTANGGEGTVIGIIDSDINWDHSSFDDPGEGLPPESGSWDHVNPYGSQLGLCSETEVLCNDKLVGVYDFVEDDPATDEVEEHNNGKDNAGHGTHVTSIAAGNPLNVTMNDIPAEIGGVAPNANIVSYRVCYIGDAADLDDDGCQSSAILSAVDQAISDGVDVINYSIGTDAYDPWTLSGTTYAFLNARAAGIFVATSTGNAGPNSGSIGAPANAPWIIAVGNATHDRVFASVLENLSGGDTTPPPNLIGTSFTDGIGVRTIVHAKDYGYALCGTGISEAQADCAGNTGASNPFGAGTFDGEIVVCDRGEYGRVEKGKNLMLAGAGGYVLANTEEWGEGTVADNHCLPAIHLGYEDSEKLRPWLDGGINHQGAISGFSIFHIPEAGDLINRSSSRGPNSPLLENILKPDVIAPGTEIMGASSTGNTFLFLSGTSMASPHVAGGAALLKSAHPAWTPPMLVSALTMTATPELAVDHDGTVATPHKLGSGRPQLDQAVNAGLYLNETRSGFVAANPNVGGEPKDLNLPGLVDTVCRGSCNFQRTVTDLAGGAAWTASAQGFVDGVAVSITPDSFTLTNGGSRALTIDINVRPAEEVGNWVYGEIHLASSGFPDMVFPVAVFADGGQLPAEWQISSDSVSGWKEFALSGLEPMPDATFTSGGLVVPTLTVGNLPQDPTDDDPYDSSAGGTMTVWHDVPADTLWLHTETLASTAVDLDLFVGLDANSDGIAQESEELCSSTTPDDLELCDLFTPVAGSYWVIVQNWDATNDPDEATLKSAVVGNDTLSRLTATGTGIIPAGEAQTVRVSWDNVSAVPGTELIGAVGLGTRREYANNIGIIPVKFTKTGIAEPETLVLMNGISRGLTISGNEMHDLAYVDVPPGTESLTVAASGADSGQNDNLVIELYRVEFDDAFSAAPFAVTPNTGGSPLASASGAGGNGPSVTVSGGNAVPGRWYVVLKNESGTHASVEVRADLSFSGTPITLRDGLWEPGGVRAGSHQGYDYNSIGAYRGLLWYTYTEDSTPTWYLAAGPESEGNVWVATLKRFTNDGTLQQNVVIGYVSITILAEDDQIFSFVLFGDEGSDRMYAPLYSSVCPTVGDVKMSYTGLWSRPNIGVGGASVLVNAVSQGYIHYIYDENGNPVWITGANMAPESREVTMGQWSGYCAVCTGDSPSQEPVGLFTRDYADEYNMTWTLDYVLNPPLSGAINRTDVTEKLTVSQVCQ